MKRDNLLRRIAVFDEDGCGDLTLDNLKLALSPVDLGARTRRAIVSWVDIANTRELGVGYSAPVSIERRPDGLVLQWEGDGIVVQQRVGPVRDGDFSGATQTLDLNELRMARRALGPDAARYPQPPNGEDNFIDPRVRSGRAVHELGMALVFEVLHQCVHEYCVGVLPKLFGVEPGATAVRISVNEMEICWDRLCPTVAETAHHAYWRPWRRQSGTTLSSSGCLKRTLREGETLKLYPKTRDVLRFEVQLSGKCIRATLGHALDFRDRVVVGAALDVLGDRYYTEVRQVQAELADIHLVSLADIIMVGFPPTASAEAHEVFHALLMTGTAKCRSQKHYRVLCVLRNRGFVERSKAKGEWVSTAPFHRTFGVLHRLLRDTASRWGAA